MDINLWDVFIGMIMVAGAGFAYMCGHSDGCKENACFRVGSKD